ncbi:MAG TPA: hypothetical protein VL283_01025 [Candidatus Baltobacteraceae bacterium]|nr:hypothetical protein [Candidatus Baltobacteraceae bacterium]
MKNTIRQIYFYAATLIFLIMSVIAAISLLNLAMKTYVFTKADMAYGQQCDETGNMYYAPKPVAPPGETVPAVRELTAEEKAANKAACEKNLADQKSAEHQRDLVQYLSMLIVAAPLFWVHFKWVQKERETELKMADKDEKKA